MSTGQRAAERRSECSPGLPGTNYKGGAGRARNRDRGGARAPDVDEMRLAATRRTVQHERPGGPIGPPVDPAERGCIAVRNEKIGTAEGGAARQIKSELYGSAHKACSERP